MPEDIKEDKIIDRLKEVAIELKYGTITVEFKIHSGKISKGDIIEKKETLC
jgi:hypothetical protein